MIKSIDNIYDEVILQMQEMVKLYRYLLDVVRKEKEILIESNLEELNNNNKVKELTLLKLKKQEAQRIELIDEFAQAIDFKQSPVRLLDLANDLGGERGDKLRRQHSVLTMLLGRVQDLNKENEILVHSALDHVIGAMKTIKNDLNENSMYKKKGDVENQGEYVGRLVRRQV